MSDGIQHYKPILDCEGTPWMTKVHDGDWVKFTDVEAEVERLTKIEMAAKEWHRMYQTPASEDGMTASERMHASARVSLNLSHALDALDAMEANHV